MFFQSLQVHNYTAASQNPCLYIPRKDLAYDRPPIILQYSRRGKKNIARVKGDESSEVVVN